MEKKVYVAAKNMRGVWAPRPQGLQCLDVTSAQAKTSVARRELSPMTLCVGGYEGYACFENYWQAGKIWSHKPHAITQKWWKDQKVPKRRLPGSKNLKVVGARFPGFEKPLNYVESRRLVYIPRYMDYVASSSVIKKYKIGSQSVVVYDFDGPRDKNGSPLCVEVTKEFLAEKLNDTDYPFGHGYVVASMIAQIPLKDWIY